MLLSLCLNDNDDALQVGYELITWLVRILDNAVTGELSLILCHVIFVTCTTVSRLKVGPVCRLGHVSGDLS